MNDNNIRKRKDSANGNGESEEVHKRRRIDLDVDDSIAKQRLLTRVSTTRRAVPPPLTVLANKFHSFADQILRDDDEDNYAECEDLCEPFLNEFAAYEVPLLKARAAIQARNRDLQTLAATQRRAEDEISEARSEVQRLEHQLLEAQIQRSHEENTYEPIRSLISSYPSASRTRGAVSELRKDVALLEAENNVLLNTLDRRSKQFSLVFHMIDEIGKPMDGADEDRRDRLHKDDVHRNGAKHK